MDFWDKRFNQREYVFGKNPAAALVTHEELLIPHGETLVVADGEGRNSVYLAGKGFKVFATDYSSVAIEKAKKLAEENNVTVNYKVEDIYDINVRDKKYDNVIAIFIQFVPPHQITSVLNSLHRLTKVGGTLFIHGYTPEQVELKTGGPPDKQHMYTKAMLANIFSEGTVLVNKEYHDHISEGKGHHGGSALIDFVLKV